MKTVSFFGILIVTLTIVDALDPCYDKNESPFPYKLILYTSEKTKLDHHYITWFNLMFVDIVGLGASTAIRDPSFCQLNTPLSLPSLVLYDNQDGSVIYRFSPNSITSITGIELYKQIAEVIQPDTRINYLNAYYEGHGGLFLDFNAKRHIVGVTKLIDEHLIYDFYKLASKIPDTHFILVQEDKKSRNVNDFLAVIGHSSGHNDISYYESSAYSSNFNRFTQ